MPRIAQFCFRFRIYVLLFWALLLGSLIVANFAVGTDYNDRYRIKNTESITAVDVLKREFPDSDRVSNKIVFKARSGRVTDGDVRARVEAMLTELSKLPTAASVSSPYTELGKRQQISADQRIAFVNVALVAQTQSEAKKIYKSVKAITVDRSDNVVQFELSGQTFEMALSQVNTSSEVWGILAAAVVLFIAFGSLFTMFVPVLTSVFALGTSMMLIGLLTNVLEIASFSPTLAACIGLGVGVDYALLIVSRYRSNLMMGQSVPQAITNSINTAGRSVVFAALIVCVSLLGMFVVRIDFLYGAAIASSLSVIFTMIASVTLLPALLGFVGLRALRKAERKTLKEDGPKAKEDLSPGWFKWSRFVERRALVAALSALVVIGIVTTPFFSLRLGASDSSNDKQRLTTYKAYKLLVDGFGEGFTGQVQLVGEVDNPAQLEGFRSVIAQVEKLSNVVTVTPMQMSPSGKVGISVVYLKTSPRSEATSNFISDVRKNITHPEKRNSGARIYVSGTTAIYDDFARTIMDKLPMFIGAVVFVSMLLLMAIFRSVLIPITASLMNMLSAAAAFGVVVGVFQWGWLNWLIDVHSTGPIEPFVPVILFAVLFGLSMDYEVFLVSRMHEEWQHSGSNNDAIALGQAETGRVITAAAAIMMVVFASFILTGDRLIKIFGLGLASAVVIDAMIIRTVLVPSIMHLLRASNWWLPRWLDKLLPRISVEPHSAEPDEGKNSTSP